MIDAYEIGIQLMLQEDVTAGLAVINQGLADVDRAIASTSANLAGLVREAESAIKVASVAAGERGSTIAAAEQKATDIGEVAEQKPVEKAVTAVVTGPTEKAAAPRPEPVRGEAPTPQVITPPGAQPMVRGAAPREQVAPGKAATQSVIEPAPRSAPDGSAQERQLTSGEEAAPVFTFNAAPAQVTQAEPAAAPSPPPPERPALIQREARESVTPRPAQVTASVGRATRFTAAASEPERTRRDPVLTATGRPERVMTAPSRIDLPLQRTDISRMQERAAAPRSTPKSQNEAAGGTVMLDGRLVGQWLSEHMGREASRPPSGPSFFDPRQTPAWNVSGLL